MEMLQYIAHNGLTQSFSVPQSLSLEKLKMIQELHVQSFLKCDLSGEGR
jgi:hypothetical protein